MEGAAESRQARAVRSMDAHARARRVDELMELRHAARQALSPAAAVSDRVLERQWSLWEAGVASEVPSYVPRRWKGPPAR